MAWDEEMVCVCLGGGGEREREGGTDYSCKYMTACTFFQQAVQP